MAQVRQAAINVSSDKVGIFFLQQLWSADASGQDTVPEAWREPLDLIFNLLRHINVARMRHVAISPGDVFAVGRTGRIKQTGLSQ